MTDRLNEIKERLDLIDSAIPQRFVSECWGKYPPEHKSRKLPCADCDRHELERGAFNKALTMLYENGQSDIAWLIGELEKEREARWSLKFYVKQAIDHFRGSSGLLNETLEALANELRKQPPTSNKT